MPAPSDHTPEGELASWNPTGAKKEASFWAGAGKPKKVAVRDPARPRMARWKRVTLWSAASLACIVLLAVALAPTIAGSIAPGMVEKAAAKQISGKVRVENVSLSWFGSQVLGPIVITDPAKPSSEVARLNVEASPGLLSLARGALGSGPDLGDIRVSGNAKIVRSADGTTNLERALAPPRRASSTSPTTSPGRPEPARLPPDLQGHVTVTDLDVSYTDETPPAAGAAPVGTIQIKDIRADGVLSPASGATGAAISLKLSAKTSSSQPGSPDGTVKVDATVDSLTNTSGVIQAEKARIDAQVTTQGVPVAVIDAFGGLGGKLAAALGPSLDGELGAKGSLKNAQADWKFTSSQASLTGAVIVSDSVLTTSSPIVLKAQGQAVRVLADLDRLAQSGTVALSQVPDITLTVDSLKMKIPSGAPDLRGGAAKITLNTTEAKGTVRLQNQAGAKPDEFNVAPLALTIDAPDFAGPVKVKGATAATISGKPAGTLAIDLTAAGLLDPSGAPKQGLPSSIEGIVRLHDVATAIAQPFVQALNIDLPADIGPTLNLDAKATTGAPVAGASVPPVNLDVFVTGEKIDAKAGLALVDNVLRSREQGVTVNLASAGSVASRFVAPSTGWSLEKKGTLNIAASNIIIPLRNGAPVLDKAQATIQVAMAGFSARPTTPKAAAGGPVDISSVKIGATLSPGVAPKVTLDSALSYQKRPFTATGALDVPGLYTVGKDGALAVTPMNARPVGTIELKNVPTAIAGVVSPEPAPAPAPSPAPKPAPGQPAPAPPPAAAPPLDLGKLATDVIGPEIGATITTGPSKSDSGALDINVAVRAERLASDLKASVSEKQAALEGFTTTTTLAPPTLDTLLATFAPQMTPRPRLAGPSKVTFKVDPLSIPLVQDAQGKITPDLARTGNATVHLLLPDQTLLQNMVLTNADGTTKDLGSLGVEALDATATVPLAAAVAPEARWLRPFNATLKARVLDAPNSRALALSVVADGQLTGGQGGATAVESAKAKVSVTDIVPQRLDRFVGQPGMLSGALGESASLEANVTVSQADGGTPKASQTINADALLKSPLVTMDRPLKISVLGDRIKSDAPVEITWKMLPAFANTVLFAPPPLKPGEKAPAQPPAQPRLESPAMVTITLSKFAIATGGPAGAGPLKPGIFDAALTAAIPTFELAMPDGSRIKTTNLRAGLQTTAPLAGAGPNTPADLAFQITIDEAGVTLPANSGPPQGAQKLTLNGTVSNFADERGNVAADKAVINATGDLPVIPTGLVDALAKQNGLLVDALGPVCAATIRADRFGAAGGSIDVNAKSPRATAHIKGNMAQNTFISSEPITASLNEITNEMAKRMVKGLPMIGTINKTAQDQPAVLTATNMKVPLDNDMKRLNGDIVVDPGQAKFTTGKAFSGILSALHQKKMGEIGERLEPLKATIRDGVVKYERWTFPLGEFKVVTEGTVDLVNQRIDVLTYLPLGSLSEDAAKLFKANALATALGKDGLEAAFLVPWRTRGTFDQNKTEPDLDLFAKELVKNLKPEELLKKGLGDLLKDKLKKPE